MNKKEITARLVQSQRRAFKIEAEEIRSAITKDLEGDDIVEARLSFDKTLREVEANVKQFNFLEEQVVVGSVRTDSLLEIANDTYRAGHADIAFALFAQANDSMEVDKEDFPSCTNCKAVLASNSNFCHSCGCSTKETSAGTVIASFNSKEYDKAIDLIKAHKLLKR